MLKFVKFYLIISLLAVIFSAANSFSFHLHPFGFDPQFLLGLASFNIIFAYFVARPYILHMQNSDDT